MRTLPALLLILLPLASSAAPLRRDFTMRFYARFLEPGLGGAPAAPGSDAGFADLQWAGPDAGIGRLVLWRQNALCRFQTSPNRRSVASVVSELETPDAKAMDVWRQRHGYRRLGGNYQWLTLGDDPVLMDHSLGQAYDKALAVAGTLACRRALEAGLPSPALLPAPADHGEMIKPLALTYDRGGLIGTASGDFFIRLWDVPAKVSFRVRKHVPTHMDPNILELAGVPKVTFSREDLKELRRRHGLPPDSRELDALFERMAAYWGEASATIVAQGLNDQLEAALRELPAPKAPEARPALRSLRRIASTTAW